jgi:thiamine pyrophosphate-dependent acetolactate synthase large subunit-like protein
MKIVDAIAEILKREGVTFLSAYPTTSVIDATAAVGIRSVLCRQERVGVGIADGFTRITNGRTPGVFAMQYGPGAENAFAGVATAYSDSTPILLLPLGHQRDRAQVFPLFSSARTYASVTKSVETLNLPAEVSEVMRRAFSALKSGRPGPVMVEIPADVAVADVGDAVVSSYRPVQVSRSGGNPRDVEAAARALLAAQRPVIHAGQGVLYAEACDELRELAELLDIPVMTTLEGKGAFDERHPLALGTGSSVMSRPVYQFLKDADLVFGVGCSFTKHGMATNIPPGKTLVHATNDERDLNKNYPADHPIAR